MLMLTAVMLLLLALHPQIWNCSQDQSNHIVHEFFKSDHFNDGIPVIPGTPGSSPNRATAHVVDVQHRWLAAVPSRKAVTVHALSCPADRSSFAETLGLDQCTIN